MASDTCLEMLTLLDRMRLVQSAEDEDRLIDDLITSDRPLVLSFVNQHAFNLAFADSAVRQALMASDILLRDGVGIEVCLTLLGRRPGRNLNGTDLIPHLLERAQGKSVALIGTREPWLGRAADKLRHSGHEIVCTIDGFQPAEAYADLIAEADPQIVVLAMGMPKQEMVSLALRERLRGPCLIINGGAVLDFLAERQPRAPKLIQQTRMEWLFRLVLEPRRLASRYLGGGFAFLARTLKLRAYSRALDHAPRPVGPPA